MRIGPIIEIQLKTNTDVKKVKKYMRISEGSRNLCHSEKSIYSHAFLNALKKQVF
jgi:hypothetical protein